MLGATLFFSCIFNRVDVSCFPCSCHAGLQSTRLGMYIEDRVNKYLKRQNHPEAGEVFVRVVASSDKTVEVKPGMKTRWGRQWGEDSVNKFKIVFRCKVLTSETNTAPQISPMRLNRCHHHSPTQTASSVLWGRQTVPCPLGLVDALTEPLIVPGVFSFYTAPIVRRRMRSIKFLCPLRRTVEPVCLTRWRTRPVCLRGLFNVWSHGIKVCNRRPLHRGRGFYPRTCYPVIFVI